MTFLRSHNQHPKKRSLTPCSLSQRLTGFSPGSQALYFLLRKNTLRVCEVILKRIEMDAGTQLSVKVIKEQLRGKLKLTQLCLSLPPPSYMKQNKTRANESQVINCHSFTQQVTDSLPCVMNWSHVHISHGSHARCGDTVGSKSSSRPLRVTVQGHWENHLPLHRCSLERALSWSVPWPCGCAQLSSEDQVRGQVT